jgi:hypothetical protein
MQQDYSRPICLGNFVFEDDEFLTVKKVIASIRNNRCERHGYKPDRFLDIYGVWFDEAGGKTENQAFHAQFRLGPDEDQWLEVLREMSCDGGIFIHTTGKGGRVQAEIERANERWVPP